MIKPGLSLLQLATCVIFQGKILAVKIWPNAILQKSNFTQRKFENKVFGRDWCKKHGHCSKIGSQYEAYSEGTPVSEVFARRRTTTTANEESWPLQQDQKEEDGQATGERK